MVMRYMIINRAALKAEARACMRQSRTSPYLTALVYAVVTFIISQLNGRLLFPSDLVHYVLDLEEGRMWLYIAPEYYTRLYTEPFAYLLAFLLQVAGAMLGAVWVANSNKTRALVQKGQEELKERVDAYIDEKLSQMEQSGQEKKK